MAIQDSLKNSNRLYDLLIIGAGPAGLTAAIYATRAALKTAFIEADSPGGKMVKTGVLENYPGFQVIEGPELSLKMLNHALANEVVYLYGKVVQIHKIDPYWHVKTANQETYYARTVLIATGMKEKTIGIPNEVEYYGKGVSYCAVCDAALYKNRDVIVVGGGNSAVEEALYLSQIVKNVHLVHRRDQFRAEDRMVANLKKTPNVFLYTPYLPIKINVENNKVTGLTIQHKTTGQLQTINAACVFPYVGLVPVVDFVQNLDILHPESGFISVDQKMQTKHPGLYAAGDVIHKSLRQVATAINDGAIAAIEIKNYLTHDFQE